jgi:glycerophosphoryl diester phosphodiesterase
LERYNLPEVLNIAHRGSRSLAPENTLAAARKAVEIGADMWEFDISVTADGELILFHDDSLVRVSDAEAVFPDRAPWLSHTFTLSELKRLDLGTSFVESDPFGQIAALAVSREEQTSLRGETIPTLREALQFTRDRSWQANIELKKLPDSLRDFPVTEQVISMIEALDLVDQVIVSSFHDAYLLTAKALNPAIVTAVLRRSPPGNDVLSLVGQLGSRTYHPFHEITNNEEIETLRRAEVDVNVWTVNSRADMTSFIEAGVTGIITDFPQTLSQILSARK